MDVKVTSHNQKGGITANEVNLNNQESSKNRKGKSKNEGLWGKPGFKYFFVPLIVAIVAGLIIWGVTMEKENKDEKTVYVTSYDQQGGITANQVNIDTKTPRQLNDNFKTQLDSMLSSFKGKIITVTAIQGDQEAHNFAEQIKEHLDSTGWETSGISVAMIFGKPQKGVVIDPKTGAITVWGQ